MLERISRVALCLSQPGCQMKHWCNALDLFISTPVAFLESPFWFGIFRVSRLRGLGESHFPYGTI